MKPLPKAGEPVVVMATSKVVVDVVVFILVVSQEIGVKVTVGEPAVSTAVLRAVSHCEGPAYRTYPAVKVQAWTSFFSHWRVWPCSSRAGRTTCSSSSSNDSSLTGASLRGTARFTPVGDPSLLAWVCSPVKHDVVGEEGGEEHLDDSHRKPQHQQNDGAKDHLEDAGQDNAAVEVSPHHYPGCTCPQSPLEL